MASGKGGNRGKSQRATRGSASKVSGLSASGGGSASKSTPASGRIGTSVGGSKGVNTSVSVSKASPASKAASSTSKQSPTSTKSPSKSKGTSVNLSKAGSFNPKAGQTTSGFKQGTSVNLSKAGSLKFSSPPEGGILSSKFVKPKTPASKTVPLKDAPVFAQRLLGLEPLNQRALEKAIIEKRPIVLPASLLFQDKPVEQPLFPQPPATVQEVQQEQQQLDLNRFFDSFFSGQSSQAFGEPAPQTIGGLTLINPNGGDPNLTPSGADTPTGGFVGGAATDDGGVLNDIGEKASSFFESLKKDPVKLAIVVIGALALIFIFAKGGKR